MSTIYLNGIRGAAALLVVIHHLLGFILFKGPEAVDMFFLLSSFLITTNLYKAMIASTSLLDWKIYVTYTIKRLVRVWPLYFFILILMRTCLWIAQMYCLDSTYFDLFRVGILFQISDLTWHGFVLWTIPIEMTYYAIAPFWVLVYILLQRQYLRIVWCISTVLLAMVNILQINYKEPRHFPQNFPMHYGSFLLGSVLAILCSYVQTERAKLTEQFYTLQAKYANKNWLLRKIMESPVFVWYTLAWLNFFIFWELMSHGTVPIPIPNYHTLEMEPITPFMAIFILMETIYPTSIGRFFETNFLIYLGKISYPLYITHPIARMILPANMRKGETYLSMFYLLFGSIALGASIHHLIEAPLLAPLSRKLCASVNSINVEQNKLPEYEITAVSSTPSTSPVDKITETVITPESDVTADSSTPSISPVEKSTETVEKQSESQEINPVMV